MTTIDLCAGPGGWDIAAQRLGINPIGIERDADACRTRANAGLTTIRADILHFGPALDQEKKAVSDPILSIGEWTTNAELIADVAALGYLPEPVFDATYGKGAFWTKYRPGQLRTSDLRKPADLKWDWTKPAQRPLVGKFGAVVFDPPYKLNGTPTDSDRYGVDEKVTVKERMRRIVVGAEHCAALVRPGGFLLVKVQDQVDNGQMHWQTDAVTHRVTEHHPDGQRWTKEAAFHLLHRPRPQRSQVRPRNNYSTLLVFRRAT